MSIEVSILEILARRAPELVREVPLRNALEIELAEVVSLASIKTKLRALEVSGDVTAIPNADAGTKWTISDHGQARLARAKE